MRRGTPVTERITVMRLRPTSLLAAALTVVASLAAACGGGSTQQAGQPAPAAAPHAAPGPVAIDKNAYPVFPDADAGADPSVSAEQGGRGFTGKGWETNTDYDLIGDPHAIKGGMLREYLLDFPGTLRLLGPESNTALNSLIGGLVYESLLALHPTTLAYIPALATHWQVSPDKLTYRYRINPNARWSDGQPVTADDAVATWSFMMDKGLQDPMTQLVYGKFEKPVAESKYIVRVKSTQLNWRNFLYISTMTMLPAHVLKDVDGARYVKEYNFKLLPGTGPYTINEADVVKGNTVTVRRRNGYWAAGQRRNVGLNNFDEIREVVVRDQNLAFEMFKRGDLDYYYVNISRQWVEELNFDRVQRGLIQKRKIFNDNPSGVQGMAFNTRKPPFDDIRFREAFADLFNRELLIKKLFFNEYVPLNSYYAGGLYENPDDPKMPYDPQLALKLLAEAGWKDRDAQGRLVKDGRPLTVELLYASKTSEPFLTVYQDDLRKVGIGLTLRLVTPETQFQLVMERKFDLVSMAWTGLTFPNPETSYQSTLADVNNTNNISGFKDRRVDELLVAYDKEFDQQKRVAIIREIDGILANAHHYLLEWDAPFQRIAYWNRFGHPDSYLTRIGDYRDIPSMWWIDPQKEAQLGAATRDSSLKLEVGPTEVRYWSGRSR
jgi:microcin C transport system substrate-binding protein